MSTTIEQNISLGAITADPETILWAGDISGVSELTNKHPDGYKMKLKDTLDEIKVLMGNADKRFVYSHDKFVEPMLDYIVKDFERSRISMNDNSIGGMVICDSNDQARNMKRIFDEKYTILMQICCFFSNLQSFNCLFIYLYFVSTISSTEHNLSPIADTDIRQAPLTGI